MISFSDNFVIVKSSFFHFFFLVNNNISDHVLSLSRINGYKKSVLDILWVWQLRLRLRQNRVNICIYLKGYWLNMEIFYLKCFLSLWTRLCVSICKFAYIDFRNSSMHGPRFTTVGNRRFGFFSVSWEKLFFGTDWTGIKYMSCWNEWWNTYLFLLF